MVSGRGQGAFTELGDVVMLGGYPSDGKTALALMMAYHMAARYKVGFFSLETGKRKVRDRMVSHVAQISAEDIKLRTLSEEDWAGAGGQIRRYGEAGSHGAAGLRHDGHGDPGHQPGLWLPGGVHRLRAAGDAGV
ncbi:MAG: DnaB-like helicase C-terminal domain-containing protein [Dysosmobacter sp.]